MTERPRLTLVTADPPPQGWIRLVWSGDVDAFSVAPLAADLRDAWASDPLVLEVDLAGVTFLDCAGLRPLVEAHARLLDRMRLFAPSSAVTRLLGVLGLDTMFLVVGPIDADVVPLRSRTTWAGSPVSGQDADAAEATAARLSSASRYRVTVEQATGLLMATHGCDAATAWRILREHADAHEVPVDVMAGMLVDRAPLVEPPTSRTVVEDVMAERARAGPFD